MPNTSNGDHSSAGRRNYDLELAELKHEVSNVKEDMKDLREEIKQLRSDIKDLLTAWQSAKGMSTFIKWLASITVAIGVLKAKSLGWWN